MIHKWWVSTDNLKHAQSWWISFKTSLLVLGIIQRVIHEETGWWWWKHGQENITRVFILSTTNICLFLTHLNIDRHTHIYIYTYTAAHTHTHTYTHTTHTHTSGHTHACTHTHTHTHSLQTWSYRHAHRQRLSSLYAQTEKTENRIPFPENHSGSLYLWLHNRTTQNNQST